jgi:lipopolysaccharide export LptBFGC system permease protein LptF
MMSLLYGNEWIILYGYKWVVCCFLLAAVISFVVGMILQRLMTRKKIYKELHDIKAKAEIDGKLIRDSEEELRNTEYQQLQQLNDVYEQQQQFLNKELEQARNNNKNNLDKIKAAEIAFSSAKQQHKKELEKTKMYFEQKIAEIQNQQNRAKSIVQLTPSCGISSFKFQLMK